MMKNSICGSKGSFKSEMGSLKIVNSCSQNLSSPNDSSIADMSKTPSSTDLNQHGNLTPSSLSFLALKYELDGEMEVGSPDNTSWEPYFSDFFEGDFMICSPLWNVPSSQAFNMNFSNNSSPRLESQIGHKGKGLSPLHRVFNSPNNNNNHFMQTESLSQLELEGFLDGNYEKEIDDLLTFFPVKNEVRSLSVCYDAVGSSVQMLLDCLSLPDSQLAQENDKYEVGEVVIAPLSQQLHQERQQEKQQPQKLPPGHRTSPPLLDGRDSLLVPPTIVPEQIKASLFSSPLSLEIMLIKNNDQLGACLIASE